jgi:hypothetical protein
MHRDSDFGSALLTMEVSFSVDAFQGIAEVTSAHDQMSADLSGEDDALVD